VRFALRLAAWLLLSVCVLSLSSCAELALPPEQLYSSLAANSKLTGEGVIVNIAPASGAPMPLPVSSLISENTPTPWVPTPLPTVTPLLPPSIQPTPTPEPAAVEPLGLEPELAANVQAEATAICTDRQGAVRDGQFKSDIVGRRQHYYIYLPPCYEFDPTARYPVVYLLHGIPMDENHWLDEGVVEAADRLFSSGTLQPFIIVMPHGDYGLYTDTSGGPKSFEGVFVNELVPAIDGRFRTLAGAQHRAIGGISRGGVWALEIAFTHPELFSAVGGHSPALSVNRAAPQYDPITLARTAPIEQLRFFLDAGDKDWTRTETLELSKVLAARYIPHTYTVGQGIHDYPYWASQVEAYLKFYGAAWESEKIVEQLLAQQAQ
jgi:enterochelin esterase-like enzyme